MMRFEAAQRPRECVEVLAGDLPVRQPETERREIDRRAGSLACRGGRCDRPARRGCREVFG
jgi:hypothetical protein